MSRPLVFTLCGSTRFPDAFALANMHLTMLGRVVIGLGMMGHADQPTGARFLTSDGDESSPEKKHLDTLHFRKIDISDGIFVVNPGGYIGASTKREIAYAQSLGKTVEWMFPDALAARPEAPSDAGWSREDLEAFVAREWPEGRSAGAAARELVRALGVRGLAPTLQRLLTDLLGQINFASTDRAQILADFANAAPEAARMAKIDSFERWNPRVFDPTPPSDPAPLWTGGGLSMALDIPAEAVGLKLYRFKKGDDDPIPCEAIRFPGGSASVETTLRRAAISGRVEVEGKILDHFADVLDADHSIVATVALDAGSYRALKTKWMRCKTERRQ